MMVQFVMFGNLEAVVKDGRMKGCGHSKLFPSRRMTCIPGINEKLGISPESRFAAALLKKYVNKICESRLRRNIGFQMSIGGKRTR